MIKNESIEKIQAKFSSPRVAVYARPSRMDRFISTAKERKEMYQQEAALLGCGDVKVYEETEGKSTFQTLICNCQAELFDVVILFGLTWFPEWFSFCEGELSYWGEVDSVEAVASTDYLITKDLWLDLARKRRELVLLGDTEDADADRSDPYDW